MENENPDRADYNQWVGVTFDASSKPNWAAINSNLATDKSAYLTASAANIENTPPTSGTITGKVYLSNGTDTMSAPFSLDYSGLNVDTWEAGAEITFAEGSPQKVQIKKDSAGGITFDTVILKLPTFAEDSGITVGDLTVKAYKNNVEIVNDESTESVDEAQVAVSWVDVKKDNDDTTKATISLNSDFNGTKDFNYPDKLNIAVTLTKGEQKAQSVNIDVPVEIIGATQLKIQTEEASITDSANAVMTIHIKKDDFNTAESGTPKYGYVLSDEDKGSKSEITLANLIATTTGEENTKVVATWTRTGPVDGDNLADLPTFFTQGGQDENATKLTFDLGDKTAPGETTGTITYKASAPDYLDATLTITWKVEGADRVKFKDNGNKAAVKIDESTGAMTINLTAVKNTSNMTSSFTVKMGETDISTTGGVIDLSQFIQSQAPTNGWTYTAGTTPNDLPQGFTLGTKGEEGDPDNTGKILIKSVSTDDTATDYVTMPEDNSKTATGTVTVSGKGFTSNTITINVTYLDGNG